MNNSMHKIIAQIARNLSSDREINFKEILGEIGVLVAVDRVYIFKLKNNNTRMDNTHEWCAPGVEPQQNKLQDLECGHFPWWMSKLENNEIILIEDVSQLPPAASQEREILQQQGVKSALVIPLYCLDKKLLGFIGFDDTATCRNWTDTDIETLRTVGDLLIAYWDNQNKNDRLLRNNIELKQTLNSVVKTLSSIVELKDPYTAGHQERVARLAVAIAVEMGLTVREIEIIETASLLHDLGKLRIPTDILAKPGEITEEEFMIIKKHPQIGYDLIKNIKFDNRVAEIVLQHHERLNGSGYPRGLQKEDILSEARILAVADVVEAMSSHRPYRPALGIESALQEIKLNREILYDSQVVTACVRLFQENMFDFINNCSITGVKGG